MPQFALSDIAPPVFDGPLVISEFMASNKQTLAVDGDYPGAILVLSVLLLSPANSTNVLSLFSSVVSALLVLVVLLLL